MRELNLIVELTDDDYKNFEDYCKSIGCSMNDYIRFLIEYTIGKSEKVRYFKQIEE